MSETTAEVIAEPIAKTGMRRLYAFIIILCALAMMFFSADIALGAIGLKSTYTIGGNIMAGVGVLLFILTLKSNWSQGLGMWFLIGAAIFLLITLLISQGAILIFVGWIVAIPISILSYYLPLQPIMFWGGMLFIVLIVICLWWKKLDAPVLRTIARLMLFCAAFYLMGIAWQPANAEFRFRGQLTHAGNVYWLYVKTGWLGDPDTLILYECNSLGFGCTPAFVAPQDYYQSEELVLQVDAPDSSVAIYMNGSLLHRLEPSGR
jgi:hypothetical protein